MRSGLPPAVVPKASYLQYQRTAEELVVSDKAVLVQFFSWLWKMPVWVQCLFVVGMYLALGTLGMFALEDSFVSAGS